MYPSSSSQKPMSQTGLTRYGSAPGSLLTTAVDSVIGADPNLVGHYFSADSSSLTSESTCQVSSSNDRKEPKSAAAAPPPPPPHGSYPAPSSSSLLRQRSSPAGFLSHLTTDNGFSVTKGTRNYSSQGGANSGHGVSRLNSQLSFTRQDSLSQISEVSENPVDGVSSSINHQNAAQSLAAAGFGMDSWDNTNSILFSAPPGKRAKNIDGDIYNCLNALETQERRTRISGKLKKLQDLVPNMDKETSYADMLDLAVQHIKGLQNEVQKLHKELESCTCGCKQGS